MRFNHKYKGSSSVRNGISSTSVDFVPDVLRDPTYFTGTLHKKIPFREAISALHDVVVADYNFQPKDNTEYLEWLKNQEEIWLAEANTRKQGLNSTISNLQNQLVALRKERDTITKPFYKAQREYFNYLYKRDYAAWFVLDPVITVHPDQVFFECFSKDESVYGKLSCGYEVFTNIEDFKCGTTNIDYSEKLYNEFQKIRTYKETDFKIDPKGFDVQTTGEENYKELKIDLPDSWVRGFLQVSTAMTSEKVSFELEPVDIANFITVLKRNKERKSPRSIRYILKPGEPIIAIFEPWNIEITCKRSIYKGNQPEEIRVWGRRRITLLERLLPITQKFTVHLLGNGMPSFYTAHLSNEMYFTLGLSGWTSNDWTQASQLDLLAPKSNLDGSTLQTIYLELRKGWYASKDQLASKLNIDQSEISKAMQLFSQAGKVIYDLKNNVYRARELKKEGIDIESLRFSSDIDREAYELANTPDGVTKITHSEKGDHIYIKGYIKSTKKVEIVLDKDLRIISGKCFSDDYNNNNITKGPSKYMLALRLAFDKK
ncbi:SWIM zinc finger family protein [Wenyingzhuangia sp. IMCC45574]